MIKVMMLVFTFFFMINCPSSFAWNPGVPTGWQYSWSLVKSWQPDYSKKNSHPYLLNRSISYLARMKGMDYFNEHLAPYGGAIVYGSVFADIYRPHEGRDSVNHYNISENSGFGCPPGGMIVAGIVDYQCSYTDAANYADYLYDVAVKHWLGLRPTPGVMPFDKVGIAIDRDLITNYYAEDNSKEKAAIYLGWAAHLVQDLTNPYHTTNNLKTTIKYHAPFEDALDTIIRNGKLNVPLDSWIPNDNGGFLNNVALSTDAPEPSSIFISDFPLRLRRPKEIVLDNWKNSRSYVGYLKKTACDNGDILHSGQPCNDFYERTWGQVLQVQADRAVKTGAELIAMFLDEVSEASIIMPQSRPPGLAPAFSNNIQVSVNSNPHTVKLILDAKWGDQWHEDLSTSTTRLLNLDVSNVTIPEGLIKLRVRACYGPRLRECTGVSKSVNAIVDRTAPETRLNEPKANSIFSDELRVMGFSRDSRTLTGVLKTQVQVRFGGGNGSGSGWNATNPDFGWQVIAESKNSSTFANLDVSAWPEQTVALRTKACDSAENCSWSNPIEVRIDHTSADLYVKKITVGSPITIENQLAWPITAVVRNSGAAKAARFEITLRANGESTSLVEKFGLLGNTERGYKFYRASNPIECESTMAVTVDSKMEVPESNESNNSKTEANIC